MHKLDAFIAATVVIAGVWFVRSRLKALKAYREADAKEADGTEKKKSDGEPKKARPAQSKAKDDKAKDESLVP
jgi:hypothetical protein